MNRFIRGILYIIAGCAGIGCAALILGLALGRGKVDLDDYGSLNFVKNSAYNIVVKVENKLRGWLDKNGSGTDGEALSTDTIISQTYVIDGQDVTWNEDADKVENLDIDLAHCTLEICEGNESCIRVTCEDGSGDDISIMREGDTFVIRDDRTGNARRKDAYIYMEIPSRKQFQEINIRFDAGSVVIDSPLSAQKMQLQADAGEVWAEKLKTGGFTASVGAGIVEIDQGDFSGQVKLDCGVGEIELYEAIIKADADITCGMGTVDVELLNSVDIDNANYILNCGMGTIDLGNDSYSALTHEKRINNGAAHTFTVNCGMGTVTIM